MQITGSISENLTNSDLESNEKSKKNLGNENFKMIETIDYNIIFSSFTISLMKFQRMEFISKYNELYIHRKQNCSPMWISSFIRSFHIRKNLN